MNAYRNIGCSMAISTAQMDLTRMPRVWDRSSTNLTYKTDTNVKRYRIWSCYIYSVSITDRCVSITHWEHVCACSLVGDGQAHCPDSSDEITSIINWSMTECEEPEDLGCRKLREASTWKTNKVNIMIPFHSLCNSRWDTLYGLDEMKCAESGWVCPPGWIKYNPQNFTIWKGNCAPPKTRCDREWDFPDGSDEFDCKSLSNSPMWVDCQRELRSEKKRVSVSVRRQYSTGRANLSWRTKKPIFSTVAIYLVIKKSIVSVVKMKGTPWHAMMVCRFLIASIARMELVFHNNSLVSKPILICACADAETFRWWNWSLPRWGRWDYGLLP